MRVEPVPGTPYGLAILGPPESTSGAAVGSLVSGVGSVLVALLVSCVGLLGAEEGWGVWVAGAFALLAGALGVAGVALGVVGVRQTRRPAGTGPTDRPPGGRGMAVAGLVCGGAGLLVTVCVLGAGWRWWR